MTSVAPTVLSHFFTHTRGYASLAPGTLFRACGAQRSELSVTCGAQNLFL